MVAGFLWLLFLAAFCGAALALPACNRTPCVVAEDRGGTIADYEALADRLVRTGETLEIHGDCYSSCTILADRARAVTCLGNKVRLRFHQGVIPGGERQGERFRYEGYSPELRAWLDAQGGEPAVGWLTMNADQAARFWRRCANRPAEPLIRALQLDAPAPHVPGPHAPKPHAPGQPR